MERLDLALILKDCPKGTPLFSPILGEVELLEVGVGLFPIIVKATHEDGVTERTKFTSDGRYWYFCDFGYSECMLFPSKECRDWSKFKAPKPEAKPKPAHVFKPFDRVLVYDELDGVWDADFYVYFDTNSGRHQCIMHSARVCIPYEGNEHLLGTMADIE